jgi:SWI/SNF-related matrix-associated actin-dependent regulator 1 of chromatin subfamily A
MIRRLKEDVLKDLPAKQRQRIYLETDIKLTKQINAILRQNQDLVEGISNTNPESNLNFLTCWAMTGLAKLEAVKEYIGDILESDIKILVFAHHRQVLDSIQSFVLSKNIQCIRIDG